jgi:hypothetical protein
MHIHQAGGAHREGQGRAGLTRVVQQCEVAGWFNASGIPVGGGSPVGNGGDSELLQPEK